MTAQVGGEILGRWPSEANATIDHWVDIPDRLLRRSTTLTVGVDTTGNAGYCGAYLPLTLRIDAGTEVEVGGTSKPPMPGVHLTAADTVAAGSGRHRCGRIRRHRARGVQIVVGLQRFSSIPIVTQVTGLGGGREQGPGDSDPEADNWTQKSIGLPINAENGQITVKDSTRRQVPHPDPRACNEGGLVAGRVRRATYGADRDLEWFRPRSSTNC